MGDERGAARAEKQEARKLEKLVQEKEQVRHELANLRRSLVETQELALLQEAGIYEYAHPLSNAVAYRDLLAEIRVRTKDLVKQDRAVDATTNWSVNGSAASGRKMVSDFSKLLLRAYNAEADNCVRTVRPHSVKASLDRLSKSAETIARLGKTMDIRITTAVSDRHCNTS